MHSRQPSFPVRVQPLHESQTTSTQTSNNPKARRTCIWIAQRANHAEPPSGHSAHVQLNLCKRTQPSSLSMASRTPQSIHYVTRNSIDPLWICVPEKSVGTGGVRRPVVSDRSPSCDVYFPLIVIFHISILIHLFLTSQNQAERLQVKQRPTTLSELMSKFALCVCCVCQLSEVYLVHFNCSFRIVSYRCALWVSW